MLVKANVLWKREENNVYIASASGTYLLNEKASFIWNLIGKAEQGKIIELYGRKFAVKEKMEVLRFIDELRALGLVGV